MLYKHNKKRNIGLINEFFSRYIAAAFLDGRYNDIEKANNIWKKYINPRTELYKEYILFNALHEVSLKDRNVAFSLLNKVKSEAKKQSQEQLDQEKKALINEIACTLKDNEFFNRNIKNYRNLAAIQILMNAWRGVGFKGNFSDLAKLEESVIDEMLKEKQEVDKEELANVSSDDVDSLVVSIMTEKINKKYSNILNEEQTEILRLFVFNNNEQNNHEKLVSLLEKIKISTLKEIKNNTHQFCEQSLFNKLKEIEEMIMEDGKYYNTKQISEDSIIFYMTLSKLKEELKSQE